MKKLMKAIGITTRGIWDEIGGPVMGLAFGAFVALLFCGTIMAFVKFPLISFGVAAVILVALFIHKVSENYRSIPMDDFDA